MRRFYTYVSVILVFFGFVMNTYAIDAPSNLKIDSSTGNSVVLSWDAIENAYMYSVYYGKKSGINGGTYENQTEYNDPTSVEISNLDPSTYYFSVVALNDLGDESVFSPEITYDLEGSILSKNTSFALKSIEVVSLNGIELTFSKTLENIPDAVREFKIVNKADPLDSFEVLKSELNTLDNTKLLLTLDKDIKVGNEYEVTVTAIKSSDAKNIESGIDSTEIFVVKDMDYAIIESTDLNYSYLDENNIELKSADIVEEVNKVGTLGGVLGGESVELLSAAENTEKLPDTGTEHVLLLIVSLILGFGFFILKVKKA